MSLNCAFQPNHQKNKKNKSYVCASNSYLSENTWISTKEKWDRQFDFHTYAYTWSETINYYWNRVGWCCSKKWTKSLPTACWGRTPTSAQTTTKKLHPLCVIQRSFNFDLISLFDLFYEWALGFCDWPGCTLLRIWKSNCVLFFSFFFYLVGTVSK